MRSTLVSTRGSLENAPVPTLSFLKQQVVRNKQKHITRNESWLEILLQFRQCTHHVQ